MKAHIEIDHKEIEEAILEVLKARGVKVKKATLNIKRGYSDQRDGDYPDTVSASVEIDV